MTELKIKILVIKITELFLQTFFSQYSSIFLRAAIFFAARSLSLGSVIYSPLKPKSKPSISRSTSSLLLSAPTSGADLSGTDLDTFIVVINLALKIHFLITYDKLVKRNFNSAIIKARDEREVGYSFLKNINCLGELYLISAFIFYLSQCISRFTNHIFLPYDFFKDYNARHTGPSYLTTHRNL